ncbi:flagellar basal body P-ring protein FlgI [Oceanotoga sp. DSM 15011]|jgi:flagellar P-ring protein precursor FlgI|uniref:flagellar basal body P-ring protein FlgI n=1 Tax=Oceanotoga TaxID=1255275 RepID=UPI0021F420C0|nr:MULTISPECIES: flagellar basal body P-ring protein FlgI [Oceanotoga]MDO7975597.1 flagellar basal body P-ring protein FlgI [Oceanotoga teriensis]UYO99896.1 flagellar basal body P-ring protein FlgI [Oceanotoga sp. DSM 15011]
MSKKLLIVSIIIFSFAISFSAVRIKDISEFRGARDNQLFGIGLVTGLNGSGDSGNISSEMLSNMMANLGLETDSKLNSKNTAVVMVFANIPAFYKPGMKLDVTVTAVGDAKSIENGYLIQTPLQGADKRVYAVAQGSVITGGTDVKTSSNQQKKYKISGSIPQGAIVENEIPTQLVNEDTVTINLKNPDLSTASRVSRAINVTFSNKISKAIDASSIKINVPAVFEDDLISFLAMIEDVEVQPDNKAKIIINEKTGSIIFGGNVKVADTTTSYGNFVLSIKNGQVNGNPATIDNVISALKAAGAVPQDLIAIIQNLSAGNFIYADLVVM